MTDRELMQQALEALNSDHPDIQLRAAISLRQALETEHRPVSWRAFDGERGYKMNERFRLLAEQVEWRFADRLTGEFSEYDKRLLKFAQLIVKECAEICLEANDHDNILRHFGVSNPELKNDLL